MQRTIQRCESSSQKLEQQPLPGAVMSTPLEDMMPQHSPQNSRGGACYNHQMARHLSAGHIPGMESHLSPPAHLPLHGSLAHMDSLARHSARLPEPAMGSHMVSTVPSMFSVLIICLGLWKTWCNNAFLQSPLTLASSRNTMETI